MTKISALGAGSWGSVLASMLLTTATRWPFMPTGKLLLMRSTKITLTCTT